MAAPILLATNALQSQTPRRRKTLSLGVRELIRDIHFHEKEKTRIFPKTKASSSLFRRAIHRGNVLPEMAAGKIARDYFLAFTQLKVG